MKIECPNCKTAIHLKAIQYGMPGIDFDFDKFHSGGCIPSEATVHCSKCEWEDDASE
jgi:hypothetical protein